VTLTVEGHADERGTREYNLALGERRANSVRDYLVALGINPARLSTVSYGEERPAVLGSSESAWAQNRRGVFAVN
jgi:peptidoglycan-associated lipoprotein